MRAPDNHTISQLEEFPATITHGSLSVDDTIHVVKGTEGLYLSWITAQKLTFNPEDYPVQQGRPLSDNVIAKIENPDQPQRQSVTSSPGHVDVDEDSLQVEFPQVFIGTIHVMPGEALKIVMSDNPTPFCVKTPCAVTYAYRDKLKSRLYQMVQNDINEPVTEPTECCAPIVITPKRGSDDIRICVDLSKLNKYIVRERY